MIRRPPRSTLFPCTPLVRAKGDYNGDGKSDILLRNSDTGYLWEYQMNGSTILASNSVSEALNSGWMVVA